MITHTIVSVHQNEILHSKIWTLGLVPYSTTSLIDWHFEMRCRTCTFELCIWNLFGNGKSIMHLWFELATMYENRLIMLLTLTLNLNSNLNLHFNSTSQSDTMLLYISTVYCSLPDRIFISCEVSMQVPDWLVAIPSIFLVPDFLGLYIASIFSVVGDGNVILILAVQLRLMRSFGE